jgi:phosphoglycolate phosphatase-like HAD superfamily hydrolase
VADTLILDFDGVVCDALTECALVAWLGVHKPDPATPISAHLASVPGEFRARFRRVRDHARLIDHFVVAHHEAADSIRTNADFARLFASIPPRGVARFARDASAARRRCRIEESSFWVDLHTIYDGIPELLGRYAGRTAIVTAKDEESVWAVLRRHRLDHAVVEVVGECARKAAAVVDLCRRRGLRPRSATFIDDNLDNVLQVAATGARALWAGWGYATADDLIAAAGRGVPRLDPAALPTLSG